MITWKLKALLITDHKVSDLLTLDIDVKMYFLYYLLLNRTESTQIKLKKKEEKQYTQ